MWLMLLEQVGKDTEDYIWHVYIGWNSSAKLNVPKHLKDIVKQYWWAIFSSFSC